ncbi:hypothetical protein [Acinetobacter baumannii]|uniref:Uncharacterized protein n=4 Tax=Moraxellaceae TaxID=468 RepID=A0AAX1ZM90_ACIBA|nr:hypothetical protein [Acinetobacter baumannii]EHU2880867.1 hypothetical protein [Acinetobacter baumannii]EHU3341228.1 hypothetical protein [Acinetobacter baumannii]EIB7148816.1 hypothetical protein [Acinetobacter baumannii]EIB7153318.1 hypothetical protein [Acinetobacter baumannii]EIB7166402.1 hypothetical protein [Acinetobacter baumannii]
MDKCREEFEKQKYWIGLFRADVDFDMTLGKFGRYVSNGSRRIDAMYLESFNEKWEAWANAWQHQQAKVEELKATIKGNHGRIAELERLNRVKAQAIIDLHQEITELKASHHGEVIGHEVHFKKIKQERDELQALYTQQGINMLKLQKRVDAALKETQFALQYVEEDMRGNHEFLKMAMIRTFKALEQVLNGGEPK